MFVYVCIYTACDIVHRKLCHFIQAFRPRLDSGGSQIFDIKRFLHDTNHALLVPKEPSCLLGLLCVIRESLLCPGLYNQRVSSVCSQLISQSPRGSAFSVSASVYRLYVLHCFCYDFICRHRVNYWTALFIETALYLISMWTTILCAGFIYLIFLYYHLADGIR